MPVERASGGPGLSDMRDCMLPKGIAIASARIGLFQLQSRLGLGSVFTWHVPRFGRKG